MALKIAISGTHSTGKTTAYLHLRSDETLRQYFEFLGEHARKGIEQGFKQGTLGLQNHCIFNHVASEESMIHRGFISDRSLIDALAYTIYFDLLPSNTIETIKEALHFKNRYDLVLLFDPMGMEWINDGVRMAEDSRKKIADIIADLSKEAGRYVHIIVGKSETRPKQAEDAIFRFILRELI